MLGDTAHRPGSDPPRFKFHCTRLTVVRIQNVSSALPAITLKGSCASQPGTNEPVTASDPDFLYAAPDQAACAAFIKESRIKCAKATKPHRKSGGSLLPCKAYHDESPLRSRLIDAVPCALIVYAVLLCDSVVSVLDRRVGFDYPERALAGILLQITHVVTGVPRPAARLDSFSFKSGFL
jgi:hypothetical protein